MNDTTKDELPGMLAVAKGVAEQKFPHTMDAAVWAAEFVKLNPGADEGTMLGWFANAIMAGYDTAQSRLVPSAVQRRCAKCGGCETPGMPASCDCPEPRFVPSSIEAINTYAELYKHSAHADTPTPIVDALVADEANQSWVRVHQARELERAYRYVCSLTSPQSATTRAIPDDEEIRQRFEKWAARQDLNLKRKGDNYAGPYTSWTWEAFYAASMAIYAEADRTTTQK